MSVLPAVQTENGKIEGNKYKVNRKELPIETAKHITVVLVSSGDNTQILILHLLGRCFTTIK